MSTVPNIPTKTKKSGKISNIIIALVILLAVIAIALSGFWLYMAIKNNRNNNNISQSQTEVLPEIHSEKTELATSTIPETSVSSTENNAEEETPPETAEPIEKRYYMDNIMSMTAEEIVEICNEKYSVAKNDFEGISFALTSPVFPGYTIGFTYDGEFEFTAGNQKPIYIELQYGDASETISLGMTYKDFVEKNGIPDSMGLSMMNEDLYINVMCENCSINCILDIDNESYMYIMECVNGNSDSFKPDEEISQWLMDLNPCISKIKAYQGYN